MKHGFKNKDVAAVFAAMPEDAQKGAMALRDLILQTADGLDQVSHVEECLRWGQPSYVSPVGTTLRIGLPKAGGFAIYAHCQSSVISEFAQSFGQDFEIEGNRAVRFGAVDDIQPDKLVFLIRHGLLYKV